MTADRAVYRAFQFGLGIFGLTALLGLANATRIFGALSQDALLTHLHSGTLGWITMGVIGVAIWMFAGRGETLSRNVMISGLVTAAYVLAFWSGNFPARAISGTLELLVIVYWWWWTLAQARTEGFGRIDVPKLSLVLGLTILTIGAIIGVTIQVFLALGVTLPTAPDLIGTHASAQIGGYLVLVSAGVAEWRLAGGGSRSRAGLAQAYLDPSTSQVLQGSLGRPRAERGEQPRPGLDQSHPQSVVRADELLAHRSERPGGLHPGRAAADDHRRDG